MLYFCCQMVYNSCDGGEMMKYNYHTHTYRCNHATGTEREYIEKAISVGIKKMGFSDHIPFIYPDGREDYYRVPKHQESEYINTVLDLKKEYEGKIKIYLGYEIEYYPKYFDEMVNSARAVGATYLILGQHFVGQGHFHWTAMPTDDEELLKEYADCVVAGINSGYITYVAHPDLFNFTGDDEVYEREMRKICKAAKATNTPLEVNFLGIRDNRAYPREDFWRIAGEEGCSAVFGFDAHDVEGAGDITSLSRAKEIIKKYNIKYIDDPKLITL